MLRPRTRGLAQQTWPDLESWRVAQAGFVKSPLNVNSCGHEQSRSPRCENPKPTDSPSPPGGQLIQKKQSESSGPTNLQYLVWMIVRGAVDN